MFKWKEEYEVGVDFVDDQHKKLFEIANRAYELMKNELYIDKYNRIIEIIHELKEYTAYHFTEEEQYMIKNGYRKFLSHKVEHDDFINKFNGINYERIDDGQDEYILELLNFIYEWIKEHILIKDKHYSKNIIG
jgi:hemerythrin